VAWIAVLRHNGAVMFDDDTTLEAAQLRAIWDVGGDGSGRLRLRWVEQPSIPAARRPSRAGFVTKEERK
jgi:hypothetical protein